MTLTKQFQDEVAFKMTSFLTECLNEIKRTDRWLEINDRYGNSQGMQRDYCNINDFRQTNNFDIEDDSDISRLFLCEKLIQIEAERIKQRAHYRRRPLYKILECVSEASSRYFENDGANILPGHVNGRPIYSPVIDLAIVPTVQCRRNVTQPIGIYPLYNGNLIFGLLSRLSFISRLTERFGQESNANYTRVGLHYHVHEHNYRPLSLFAIEIENQINKKHLMGDFINSLMLSRFPMVIVPENRLDDCLELVKLTRIISEIKQVNIYAMMQRVMILSVTQFRRIIDQILIEKGLERLRVREFI